MPQVAGRRDANPFAIALIPDELDRRRLHSFVEELEEELGSADEAQVAEYSAAFARTAAITAPRKADSQLPLQTQRKDMTPIVSILET